MKAPVMFLFRLLHTHVVMCFILLFSLQSAFADDRKDENTAKHYKWFFTLYGGAHAQPNLDHVLTFQSRFEDGTYIMVGALAREFYRYKKWISFEVEGQIGKYFGQEHQWQFNGLIIGRWHRFPWDNYLDTSFAIGDGLSYNTEVSEVEEKEEEDAGRLLNYLLFEFTLKIPKHLRWDLVFRIHHRSSVGGLFGEGGSNFVTIGIKYSL
jgi:hypothetical protein